MGAFSDCQRHENACLGFDFHRNVSPEIEHNIDKEYNAGAKERLHKQLIFEKSKLIKRPSTKKTEEQGASSSNAKMILKAIIIVALRRRKAITRIPTAKLCQ